MATLTTTPIKTFVSGETVTPTKLNELSQSTVALTAGTIVAADIAADAVTTAKILDANVTTAKLADSAVTTAKINNAAITAAKLDSAQTGSAPIYGCRAWVNFDGTKDTASAASTANTNRLINASGNVASVLRNGAGSYTVTFTTELPNANYAITGCVTFAAGTIGTVNQDRQTAVKTTTQCRVATLNTQAIAFYDSDSVSLAFFG